MILRRLRVERFRQHNLPVEIVFDDRITIVSGLNEAGKSTLFTALQYAFFRRSSAKGKDVESLAPWDTYGLSTTVTVEFSHLGGEYRLEKVWGKRASTTLLKRDDADVFTPFMEHGADDFIAGIFAGQTQARSVSTGFTGQQMGLAYLLFVPQAAIPIAGDAKQIALNPDARARLTQIVGASAQSPQAAHLAKRVVTEYDKRFTKNGERSRARGVRSIADEIARLEALMETTQAGLADFQRSAEDLENARLVYATASSLARSAEEAAKIALPRYEATIELARKREDAATAVAAASSRYDALLAESERFEKTMRERELLGPERDDCASALASAETECKIATAARVAAYEAIALVNAPDGTLDDLERDLAVARGADAMRAQRDHLSQRVAAVSALANRIAAIDVELADFGAATHEDLEKLKAVVEADRTTTARLEATLTSIVTVAETALRIEVAADGAVSERTLAAGDRFESKASGASSVRIPGVASFEIVTPMNDAADLRTRQAAARNAIAEFERRFGTCDPFAMHDRIVKSEALTAERKTTSKDRDRAREGDTLEAMRDVLASLESDLERAPSHERVAECEAGIRAHRDVRSEQSAGANAAMKRATAIEQAASEAVTNARTRLAAADHTHRTIEATLAELRKRFPSNDDRASAQTAAYAARFEAQQRYDSACAEFAPYAADADPMATYNALHTTARARGRDEQDARLALARLEADVERSYRTAPAAALVELEEKLHGLRLQREDERLNDDALRLLRTFVVEAEARRVERFAQPVLDRVAPWFSDVTGKQLGGLDLNADNDLARLQLVGVKTPVLFEELSQGTGDQLALLVRLAFASLLTAPTCLGPMPILLDDPLVHADAPRRLRFQRILETVSQNAQIVVFTCRPEDYRDIAGSKTTLGTSTAA